MAGDDHKKYRVNVALYTQSVEATGIAEADLWYNDTEGRVKVKNDDESTGIAGPHGSHPIVYSVTPAWYNLCTENSFTFTTVGTMTQNRAYAFPVYPGRKCTVSGLAIETVTGGAAGARPIRAALYDSDATTGLPGALIADYGTTNATETGAVITGWTVSSTLKPVPYWFVMVLQSSLATTVQKFQGGSTLVPVIAATPTMSTTDFYNCVYSDTGFSGAAPGTFGTVAGTSNGPTIYAKINQ